MNPPSICLIVPVYNEYRRLSVATYSEFLSSQEEVHLIFVNDASTDKTEDILTELSKAYPSRVEILCHKRRLGKAEAIRTGILRGFSANTFGYFGFIDADLAVPLTDILFFAARLYAEHGTMAFGIRVDTNKKNISRTIIRRVMGNIFKMYMHRVLKFRIADSQCGAKVFAAEIVPVLYNAPFQTRWLSDIELLIRICSHFQIKREDIHKQVTQIPVSKFQDKANSKFNAIELVRVVKELIVISFFSYSATKGKEQ